MPFLVFFFRKPSKWDLTINSPYWKPAFIFFRFWGSRVLVLRWEALLWVSFNDILCWLHSLICRLFQTQPWATWQRGPGAIVAGVITWHTSWSNGWRQLGCKACEAWSESWRYQQYYRWLVSLRSLSLLLLVFKMIHTVSVSVQIISLLNL